MKKVININFQGRVVMIEEDAYENLKMYIDSLRKHFANEEGNDEIINDIENRISELFDDVIKKGSPCVSTADLDAIIKSIGRPEDFEEESTSANTSQSKSAENQSQQSFQQSGTDWHKQFFRDENNKKIGGVCAGLANYFNIDVTWVRLIALVLLVFYGVGFIPYIILWIALPSSATQVIGSSQKRLYRDLSHKTIGGVCAGLANYFNISIWIPKVIFLVGAICSLPISILSGFHGAPFFFPGINGIFVTLYVILWSVVPAAVTASEKLSMKGENVDLNSIKNTVQEDLSDNKKGKKKVNNTTMNYDSSQQLIPVKERSTLGNIIVTLFKVFAYFVLGCILFAIICSLFAIGVGAFGLLPFKGYLISGTWQNTLAILTIIFFIWLPVVGIIVWIIRSLTKSKSNSYLRITLWGLWIVGLMSFISLIISVHQDISEVNNPVTQPVSITNPKVQELTINYERLERPFRFSRHWIFGRSSYSAVNVKIRRGNLIYDNSIPSVEDSVLINNTDLQFTQSPSDSFQVYITKLSNGRTTENANILADKINYAGIAQQDSLLNVPSYFAINQTEKFRNQFVLITIAVPVGKKIIIHQNDGFSNKIFLGFMTITDYNNPFDIHGYYWNFDKEYVMTKEGLKPTHLDTSDDDDDDDDNSSVANTQDSVEAVKQRIEKQQKKLDEEKQHLKEINEQKKKSLEQQLQQLKNDSEKINAVSIKFESPILLLGKAFIHNI